jgi:hypothetical protein
MGSHRRVRRPDRPVRPLLTVGLSSRAEVKSAWSSIRCTTASSPGLRAVIDSRAASSSSSGFTRPSRTKPARDVASYDPYSAAHV